MTTERLLLLADTHIPRRAKRLPDEVFAAIDESDVVIHAGDWVDLATVDLLQERSRRLFACWGNNDGPDIRARLSERVDVTLGGVRVTVVHETGPAQGRERRIAATYPDTDVLVFGHSHIPWDTVGPTGMRLLNPGSPTDRRRQPYCTYMTATVAAGEVTDVELHRIPRAAATA